MSTPGLTPAESLTVTSESAPVWQNLTRKQGLWRAELPGSPPTHRQP